MNYLLITHFYSKANASDSVATEIEIDKDKALAIVTRLGATLPMPNKVKIVLSTDKMAISISSTSE